MWLPMLNSYLYGDDLTYATLKTFIQIKYVYLNYFRVAMTPVVAATLIKKGFNVNVEAGAGAEAKFRDEEYQKAGAKLVDKNAAFDTDIIVKVRQPLEAEINSFKPNSTLISFLYPAQNKALVDQLASRKINAFGK